jgi:hypothetical protein
LTLKPSERVSFEIRFGGKKQNGTVKQHQTSSKRLELRAVAWIRWVSRFLRLCFSFILRLRHLGLDVTLQRVTSVIDAFVELCQQNVRELPPGSLLAWRKLLTYTGSCFRHPGHAQACACFQIIHGIIHGISRVSGTHEKEDLIDEQQANA